MDFICSPKYRVLLSHVPNPGFDSQHWKRKTETSRELLLTFLKCGILLKLRTEYTGRNKPKHKRSLQTSLGISSQLVIYTLVSLQDLNNDLHPSFLNLGLLSFRKGLSLSLGQVENRDLQESAANEVKSSLSKAANQGWERSLLVPPRQTQVSVIFGLNPGNSSVMWKGA